MPAISAIVVAGRPTTCVLGTCAPPRKTSAPSAGDFIGGKKIRVLLAALFQHLLADGFFGDDRLLGRADGAVVERLAGKNIGDGFLHVGGALDQRGNVAGANAVSGASRAIRGADETCATGGEDYSCEPVFHQLLRALHRGVFEAGDQSFGGAHFQRGLAQHGSRFANAAHGGRDAG